MTAGTDEGRRTPPLIAAAFGLIIVLLLVSIGLQAGVINPTAQSNQSALNSQGAEIRAVACAQAESTANAFRFRQIGPNGKIESREHFVTRMLAQRHTLEAAQHIGCTSANGFPPFEKQVKRALHEIALILGANHVHHPTAAATAPGKPASLAAAQGGDASDAQPGSSQPGRHEGGSGGSEQAGGSPHHHPAPVSGEQGGGGEDVPSPTKESSESSSQSSSSQTTERVESTTVVEPPPEAAEPVGKAVGGVVEEVGETATGTVEGVEATTCGLAKALCHE